MYHAMTFWSIELSMSCKRTNPCAKVVLRVSIKRASVWMIIPILKDVQLPESLLLSLHAHVGGSRRTKPPKYELQGTQYKHLEAAPG